MNTENRDRITTAGIPIIGNIIGRIFGGIADRIAFRREMREQRQRAEMAIKYPTCPSCGHPLVTVDGVTQACRWCDYAARYDADAARLKAAAENLSAGSARTGCPNSVPRRVE